MDSSLAMDLRNSCPDKSCAEIIPYEMAQKLGAIVYKTDKKHIYIIMQNPENEHSKQILEHQLSNLNKTFIIMPDQDAYFAWLIKALKFIQTFYQQSNVANMLDFILQEAISFNASDIHIETKVGFASVRFRIDGYLREIGRIRIVDFTQLVSKIKLESNLDITETRLPQDGRYQRTFNHIEYDFRISCVPLMLGESVVMRILYKHSQTITLTGLGINHCVLSHLKQSIKRKNGLILITGPTGSGKSTTLYALLEELKSLQKKIITLEDPIEYQIPLATQVQINPEIGFSFFEALRSVLRQDPDIIMIGEIRDKQTLDLALNASLTGHLVLASLHSNDCLSTLDRLFEMGAQSSIVATSLLCIVAQRLVGRLCEHCKVESNDGFSAKGCDKCDGTGVAGREVIAQSLFIDEALKQTILQDKDLKHTLSSIHIDSLKDDALTKRDRIDIQEILQLS